MSLRLWLLAHRLQYCRATFLRPAAADTRFACVDAYATFRRRPALESWRKASQRMRLDCPSTQMFSKSPCDVRGSRYSQFDRAVLTMHEIFHKSKPHRPGSLGVIDRAVLSTAVLNTAISGLGLFPPAWRTCWLQKIFSSTGQSSPHRPGSLDYERNFWRPLAPRPVVGSGQTRCLHPCFQGRPTRWSHRRTASGIRYGCRDRAVGPRRL